MRNYSGNNCDGMVAVDDERRKATKLPVRASTPNFLIIGDMRATYACKKEMSKEISTGQQETTPKNPNAGWFRCRRRPIRFRRLGKCQRQTNAVSRENENNSEKDVVRNYSSSSGDGEMAVDDEGEKL